MEILEVEVPPFQPGQLSAPKARRHIQEDHGSFSNAESCKELLHLFSFENLGYPFPLSICPTSQ